MQKIDVPLPDSLWLAAHYRDYASPRSKIVSLEKKKEIVRLKRGLYVTAAALEEHFPPGCIANRLYGPSYVSFAYALRLYNLIPEHVPHVTSATRGKRRKKRFATPIGTFFYRDVPEGVYHKAVTYREENGARYLVATPEKALCDELSTITTVRTLGAIERLLFDDLRIDTKEFAKLDVPEILLLAPFYQSTAVGALAHYLRNGYYEKRP